ADEGQLMVFLEEDHHPVVELDALRLGHRERAQRRRFDLPVVLHLRGGGAGDEHEARRERGRLIAERSHFASPFVAGAAAATRSIMPMVRLFGTNVALATRRMSAAVTLSMSSMSRKSWRQSPYSVCDSASWRARPELLSRRRSRPALARVFTDCSSSA